MIFQTSIKIFIECWLYALDFKFKAHNIVPYKKPSDYINITMLSDQYRHSHYKHKTILWLSYLYNGNSNTWKASLHIEIGSSAPNSLAVQLDTKPSAPKLFYMVDKQNISTNRLNLI